MAISSVGLPFEIRARADSFLIAIQVRRRRRVMAFRLICRGGSRSARAADLPKTKYPKSKDHSRRNALIILILCDPFGIVGVMASINASGTAIAAETRSSRRETSFSNRLAH